MNQHQLFETAVANLQAVIDIAPLTDAQHALSTPCSEFSVDELTEHILDTHQLLLAAAGGRPVTSNGSLSSRHTQVAAAAATQWQTRGTAGTIDLGGNELPAAFALSLHTLETYVHAWDLAKGLDRAFNPSDELTSAMWTFAEGFITDDVRGDSSGAAYRSAVEVPVNATSAERIIALAGRDPRWRQH